MADKHFVSATAVPANASANGSRLPSDAGGVILVVDDDRLNRIVLEQNLTAQGHSVVTAEDGRHALELLERELPDVILLDILMPGIDGFAVLEHVKRDARLQEIPVIMISALDDMESVIRCIEAGAEDFLPKPFDRMILEARINAGLTKRRLGQLEKARVRDVFGRFLPETIVDEVLLRAGADVRLGGVRLVGTALFTDIRGFTTFAEANEPDEVIDVLNRFFSEMSDAVLDNGGTLVSYLGDGMLAVFGAPIACDDHADRALATAREMLSTRLPRFNAWLERNGRAGFDVGIGVSSGPFMSGNIGSDRRLDYTAIGDTVNTASRIESHTKQVPYPVLFSDTTYGLLSEPNVLMPVGEVTLRGRTQPTRLWGLSAS